MALFVTLNDIHKNRWIKPRYAKTQATAQAVTLGKIGSPAAYPQIFPGMVLKYTTDTFADDGKGTVIPVTGQTDTPAGICADWLDEVERTGANDVAMWVLGSDAIMAVDEAALGSAGESPATWATTAPETLLYGDSNGKLTTAAAGSGTSIPVARVVGWDGSLLIAGCL